MSRIGKRILVIPENVSANYENNLLKINGPLGTLEQKISPKVDLKIEDKKIFITRRGNEKTLKMIHGTMNSLVNNMIIGVTKGYSKTLEINGVGYNVIKNNTSLTFSLGYSHKIILDIPKNLTIDVKKPTELIITGIDKQLVGQFACKIRLLKKPEPYGGKGIKYSDEQIIRKSGKASSK